MKKNSILAVTILLTVILGAGPLLTLAATSHRAKLPSSVNEAAPSAGRPRAAALKTARGVFASKLLLKRSPQDSKTSGALPGQSVTLLPDGRLLKIGGLDQDGPVASAAVEGSGGEAYVRSFELHRARAWHTATTLPDGNILIVGGLGADGHTVDVVEVFDPKSRTSEILAVTGLAARVYHTATLLTEGLVLVTGGLSDNGEPLKDAQLWDFRTKAVTTLRSKLRTPRYNHAAALLPNGKVLLSGGLDKNGASVETGELYDPETQRFTKANPDTSVDSQTSIVHPQVAASLPDDGATNVATDTWLAVRFSKALRFESVNTGTVTLSGPTGTVAAKVVPAEGGMLAFITPQERLARGSTYSLSFTGPTDLSGLSLPNTTISFTTAGERIPINLPPPDDEEWLPADQNFAGNWTSGRSASSWQSLPPLQADAGITALAGQVVRLNGKPLANVTIQIEDKFAETDDTGRFLITHIRPGHREMIVHGHTASKPGKHYGMFEIGVDVIEGRTTPLAFTIWMPVIDTQSATHLDTPTRRETIAKTSRIPGLELHVPAGVVLRAKDRSVLNELTITPIPVDRPPLPLPKGTKFFFTLQTHGARVESVDGSTKAGIRMVLPNYTGFAPGSRVELMSYNWELGWRSEGQGSVSKDGKQVAPDSNTILSSPPCMWVLGPASNAPATWPAPGGGESGGDPVDLGTGLFVLNSTDLVLPDIIPIVIGRTYRQNYNVSREFGVGTACSYDLFLVGNTSNTAVYTYAELILPDGGRIRYERTSSGTGLEDAIMEHTATPTAFYKSTLSWDDIEAVWKLRLKSGTVLRFRGGQDTSSSLGSVLVGIQDRYGNQLVIARYYDSKISRITSPSGRWVDFTYSGSITQIKDNIGRTVSYTYDASGRLWKVTNPNNEVTEYGYDASHRMTTIKDARLITYLTNEYDANGRVMRQTQADTTTFQFSYTLDGNGKVTQTDVTDPRGFIRRVTFNAAGYSLTDTFAVGRPEQQSYTYERLAGSNLVSSMTDALGRRTEFSYNSYGNVTSITRLAGTAEAVTTSFTYEPAFKQVATVTDPLNHTTTFGYDTSGKLTSATDPLNHTITLGYNSAGQLTSATDALSHSVQYGYESGDLATVTDPLGNSARRFVDAVGRLVSASSPLGQKVKYEYNNLNRVTRVTDPIQGATSFAYDPNGNLLSVTDARNKAISYHYDNMDRVDTRTDPLLKQTTYLYDNNGNLRQTTDRKNQVTGFTYDALNRLTLVTYADTSATSYTYDAGNRLTQVADSVNGTITYGYDNLDRLTGETTSLGTVSYGYDAGGRLTSKTIPGQAQISYVYDDANRLTQIQQGTATVAFVYDNGNRLTSETLPNGVVTEYAYDNASRLTSITYRKGATTLGNLTYEYDAAGRRTKMGGSFARTGLPPSLSSAGYNDANRQTAFGSQTLTYDDNGNLTSDGTNTYTWNVRNQLVSMSGPGLSASFAYDAVGRRRSKTINGATTSFLYDGANIVQEQVGGSASANALTGGVDQFFTRTDSSGTATPLRDGPGSVIALADSSGAIQTTYSYEPFGKTTVGGAASSNAQKYTGREDDGTGLYYYRARYYSPALQRFIAEDPIGLAGGINQYAYVENNPTSFRDPLGLEKMNDRGWKDSLVEFWFQVSDIRAAQDWWNTFHEEQIRNGNWLAATGGDILNRLLSMSELREVQSDGEILGSDASVGRKVWAGLDLVRIGATWYFVLTGDEIVPEDPKQFRIAPAGNRAWRWGYEEPGLNELPHYHYKRPGPGGSYKWHRPWQKGF